MEEAFTGAQRGAITHRCSMVRNRIWTPAIRPLLPLVNGAFITVPDTDGALKEAMNALELTSIPRVSTRPWWVTNDRVL